VTTPTLNIAYEDIGDAEHFPLILLHGFPDDVRAYDGIVPLLVSAGYRVLVPYLRGYGPTRFLSETTFRSGQQAAIGMDAINFADALNLRSFGLVGYDWGGRAACIVSALYPERVGALVTIGGYLIQNTLGPFAPDRPEQERALWYQWYFCTDRGRSGLAANRYEFCKSLWELWSPTWRIPESEYELTEKSFHNPDFVEIVIHSYRHRNGVAPGDPQLQGIEDRLSKQPKIMVPTVVLHGADDGVAPPFTSEGQEHLFAREYRRQLIRGAGHLLVRERPDVVAHTTLELLSTSYATVKTS
jgi:pimeloyl-ACP methyl ester carboxylesterase